MMQSECIRCLMMTPVIFLFLILIIIRIMRSEPMVQMRENDGKMKWMRFG